MKFDCRNCSFSKGQHLVGIAGHLKCPGEGVGGYYTPREISRNERIVKPELPTMLSALQRIAAVANHGPLIGFKDESSCLREIRLLSLKWWDSAECCRLQLDNERLNTPSTPKAPSNSR